MSSLRAQGTDGGGRDKERVTITGPDETRTRSKQSFFSFVISFCCFLADHLVLSRGGYMNGRHDCGCAGSSRLLCVSLRQITWRRRASGQTALE